MIVYNKTTFHPLFRMKSKSKTYFNLFYIALCIVWKPLQMYVLKVDGAGRTIILLSMMAFLLNWKRIRFVVSKSAAIRVWCVLTIYAMINSLIKGFVSEYGLFSFMNSNFLAPLIFLLISTLQIQISRSLCIKTMLVSLVIFILLGALHIEGNDSGRMLSEIGNMLPLTCVTCFFVSSILWVEKKMKWWVFASLVVFCFTIIIMSATRKAFGACAIILLGVFLAKSTKKRNVGFYVKLVLFFIMTYVGIEYLMDNTLIGERIAGGKEDSKEIVVQNEQINNLLLTIVGDRAIMYVIGTQVFLKNPITGIGICNYMDYTSSSYRLHTEYMVQLCENGIVGFILLWTFYYFVWKNIKRFRQRSKSLFTLFSFGLLSILFINLTSWTYDAQYIMSMYAIMIGLSNIRFYENSHCQPLQQFLYALDRLLSKKKY